MFVGGGDRKVYALDAKSGCTRWAFKTEAVVRTAISFAPISGTDQFAVFFGDVRRQCLRRECDDGRIGLEDEGGGSSCGPDHRCANLVFRRSVCAGFVDRGSDRIAAHLPMLHLSRQRRRAGCRDRHADLEGLHHPRAAASDKAQCHRDPALWSVRRGGVVRADHRCPAPGALCRDREQLFRTRRRKPAMRFLRSTLRPAGCSGIGRPPQRTASSFLVSVADRTNCPEEHGPDHDFGQSPILVTLRNGQRELVIGQKSGVVHALDPDQEGKILWQTRIGKGGPLGGIVWGSAADQDRVYVANSDVRVFSDGGTWRLDPNAGGGLFALDLASGKISMQVPPVPCGSRSQCSPALSAAVTVIPGVVFSGGSERLSARLCHVRRRSELRKALPLQGSSLTFCHGQPRLLWEVDTARDYATVNDVSARGGAMDGPGPTIVDGMLYVNSGYAQWGGLPGNVLLAFEGQKSLTGSELAGWVELPPWFVERRREPSPSWSFGECPLLAGTQRTCRPLRWCLLPG